MRTPCVLVLLAASASPAFALKPAVHADIAQKSCQALGLARETCQRIATEAYNVDAREWDDLSAHAQIDAGQTACVAADAAAARLYGLGAQLHGELAKLGELRSYEQATVVTNLVGRALHTIQDDCAHHGMPNPQHAWFSLLDFCTGSSTSPDVQDDAIACAKAETDQAMRLVAAAISQTGTGAILAATSCPPSPENDHGGAQHPSVCQNRFLPNPIQGCDFLGEAQGWDGIDRTWNNAVAVPALRAAFAAGVANDAAPAPICHGDERILSNAMSKPVVDISQGAPSCAKAGLFCLGKADDADNPFADDSELGDETGGCSSSGATGGAGLALFALGALLVRRRR